MSVCVGEIGEIFCMQNLGLWRRAAAKQRKEFLPSTAAKYGHVFNQLSLFKLLHLESLVLFQVSNTIVKGQH